jgi:hypothetical protein
LKHIADIIERGIREHPELSVGMQTEGIEVKASPIERDRQTDRERQRETEEAKRNRKRQRETERGKENREKQRETERNRETEKQKKRKKRRISTFPTEFHLERKQKHENLK